MKKKLQMPSEDESNRKAEAQSLDTLNIGELPIEEPEGGVFDAYSNVINLNWTLYDVRIRFAELIQVPEDEHPNWGNQHGVLLERVAVTIPWHTAKTLRLMLDGAIKSYEELNGELKQIKLPPAL